MKNTGTVLAAFLIGAGVGAIVGILMAPDKGSETRNKLISRAKDLAENLKDKASQMRDEFLSSAELEHKRKQEFYERAFSQDVHTVV